MANDFGDVLSNLWESFAGAPASTFDPYQQDRQLRMQALQGAMANYDRAMSTPGGFIPDAYRKMLLNQSEEQTRSARPAAGGSAWLEDQIARGKNDINLKLAMQELEQANQQRQYISQLMGMGSGQGMQQIPRQAGMVEKGAGNLFGQGVDWAGEEIFGPRKKKPGEERPGQRPPMSPHTSGGWDVGSESQSGWY